MTFSIIHTSDIHLAEPSQDQEDMTIALLRFFTYVFEEKIPKEAPLRMVSVDGDLYEALVSLNGKVFKHIYRFEAAFLRMCAERNLIVRFMRGTFEHDHDQMQHLEEIQKSHQFTNDFRYIDKIELEYIEALDLRILYLPDNLPYASSDAILEVVQEKMIERGWDYVDYASIHGFFTFTCPEVAARSQKIIYRPDQFTFVRKFCHVGHVHKHAAQDNVISNGNLDRLCFGEEDTKGAVLVVDKGETATATFIENPYTSPYTTLSFEEDESTEDITGSITAFLNKLKTTRLIHIRILLADKEKHAAIKKFMALHFNHVRYVVQRDNRMKKQAQMMGAMTTPIVVREKKGSAPTPDTIGHYLSDILKPNGITDDQIAWALKPIPK